jgi:hypothetical protein
MFLLLSFVILKPHSVSLYTFKLFFFSLDIFSQRFKFLLAVFIGNLDLYCSHKDEVEVNAFLTILGHFWSISAVLESHTVYNIYQSNVLKATLFEKLKFFNHPCKASHFLPCARIYRLFKDFVHLFQFRTFGLRVDISLNFGYNRFFHWVL